MKKQTYHRMTRKSPLRGFKLFKHKFLTRHGLCVLCAKLKLLREVKSFPRIPLVNNDLLNKVCLINEKLVTDRGIFNLSYFGEGYTYESHWYYETLFCHKRVYTVEESTSVQVSVQVRSECEEFEARFDPLHHGRVIRGRTNKVSLMPPYTLSLTKTPPQPLQVKTGTVDFLKARLGIQVTADIKEGFSSVEDMVKECLSKAKIQMTNFLEGNAEQINERLTGVRHDGEFISPDNQRLVPNTICHRCGCPVFFSSTEGYFAQCLKHDEDLYSMECDKLDPQEYSKSYEYFKNYLFRLIYFPENESPLGE